MGSRDGSIASMNTLRFQLEKIEGDDGTIFWGANLFVDELLINDRYSIDWIDLAKSTFLAGNYFILTCGCGVPDCARLHEPIRVSHEVQTIGWHIIEPKPERRFEFEKQQYRTAILEFLKSVKMVVPDSEDSMEYSFGYYGFVASDLDECIKTLEIGVVAALNEEEIA